jgi:hypothetical protein
MFGGDRDIVYTAVLFVGAHAPSRPCRGETLARGQDQKLEDSERHWTSARAHASHAAGRCDPVAHLSAYGHAWPHMQGRCVCNQSNGVAPSRHLCPSSSKRMPRAMRWAHRDDDGERPRAH